MNSTVAPARAIQEFDIILKSNPQFRLLMEPVIRAFLQKSTLQLHTSSASKEKTMLLKLETQLNAWKANSLMEPESELYALVFVHTFPGYSLINHVDARTGTTPATAATTGSGATPAIAGNVVRFDDAHGFMINNATASPGQVATDHILNTSIHECDMDSNEMFSLVAWELDMISGLDASSLMRTQRMLRQGNDAQLSVSEVLTPYFGSVGIVKEDADTKTHPKQVVLLRYQIDKTYEKIVLESMRRTTPESKLDKSIYIPVGIPSDSVRGSIILSDKMNPIMRQWVESKSSEGSDKHLIDGVQQLEVGSDKKPEEEDYFTDDNKVLCIYWLAGVIKEVATVEDILKAGKYSNSVKPILMAMAVYKKDTAASGVKEIRLFFLNAHDRQRISHTKEVVVRRISNGVFVHRPPQNQGFESDESESESDSDYDDFPDTDLFEDGSNSDDSNSDGERGRDRKVGYEKVPHVFRRNPKGTKSTDLVFEPSFYLDPLLAELYGMNHKKTAFVVAAGTTAPPPPPSEHFDNVVVEFAQLVSRLIVAQNFKFELVKSSAIVRLHSNHFIYRERTYDAEFDILETRGSRERVDELLSFEKRYGTDGDLAEPVLPFRLDPMTLPSSRGIRM